MYDDDGMQQRCSSRSGKQSKCKYTCDNPVLWRSKRAERLHGEYVWTCRFGSIQQSVLHNRHRSMLRCILMGILLWLTVLPSYLMFFEDGKRARYESSLANVEVRCRQESSRRRTQLEERVFEFLLRCKVRCGRRFIPKSSSFGKSPIQISSRRQILQIFAI